MTSYLQQILTYFRNLTLNSAGVSRDINRLLHDRDISRALSLMEDRDIEVDNAIREYNPQTHAVMKRPNKYRTNDAPYITEKLPRTRQRYINEVELFFLLGNPLEWKKEDGDDRAYTMFTEFLGEQHINSRLRQAKRLAGAETESALLFHIYRDEQSGIRKVKSVVLARSTGYRLRPLFDQYQNLTAFAYGYVTREGGRNVQHWDFQTAEIIVYASKASVGWDIDIYPNPTGKINIVYFRQPKAWDGAEPRIAREEMLDSKTGDTNNYFSDPIAAATADVIDSLADPSKPGKLIQLGGLGSKFEYINPPQSSQTRDTEMANLKESILFDTYTPDFDTDKMRGLGTLSGVAIRNAMILGYIKRDNRKEIYEELVGRLRNIVLAILQYMHPERQQAFAELKVSFEFAEPFTEDKQARWSSVAQLYTAGLVSLETGVAMLALTDEPGQEAQRLQTAAMQKQATAQEPQSAQAGKQVTPPSPAAGAGAPQ